MRRSVAAIAALLIVSAGASCRTGDPATLRVLASSELRDMSTVLDAARDATGVDVDLTYVDSLDGAERIAAGSGLDAAWFATDRYLRLIDASGEILDREPVMQSPVIVGVKRSVAQRLGWAPGAKVGWREVAAAAARGEFRFAMADPTASNAGFGALAAVATALAGGEALTPDTIDAAGVDGFLRGRKLTARSSAAVADRYVEHESRLDGIVHYENVVLGLYDAGDLDERLVLIYPDEGIVTADYPLLLLNPSKREPFEELVAYLRRTDVQRDIVETTARRPSVNGVPIDERIERRLLVEAPFPASVGTVRALLDRVVTEPRDPAHLVYVLDTSGSMDGEPIAELKRVLTSLAGLDRPPSGHLTRPPPREKATVLLATTEADDTREFVIDPSAGAADALRSMRTYVGALEADGNTVLYTSLLRAYTLAGATQRVDPSFTTSVVVLTDGDNSGGISYRTFVRLLDNQPADVAKIPAYVVLFDEAPTGELQDLARRTGGKVFDARDIDLASVSEEIRGYR